MRWLELGLGVGVGVGCWRSAYLKAKAVLSCMSESTLSPAICAAASIAVRSCQGSRGRVRVMARVMLRTRAARAAEGGEARWDGGETGCYGGVRVRVRVRVKGRALLMPPVGRYSDDAVLDDTLRVRLGDLLGVGEDEGDRLLRLVRAVAVLVLRALALLVLDELVPGEGYINTARVRLRVRVRVRVRAVAECGATAGRLRSRPRGQEGHGSVRVECAAAAGELGVGAYG